MNLFQVTGGSRIRVRSNTIKLVLLSDLSLPVARDVVWEGRVTDRYFEFPEARRRLVVDLNVNFWKGYGIWLRDVEVEVLSDAALAAGDTDDHGAGGGGGNRLAPDAADGEA